MLKFLIRLFIKDHENVRDARVRRAYGTLCSVYGIFLNVLLFAGKYFAGALSGSVAIIADAFNNLSDAGSSVVTLLGFIIAGKKPDPEHPFGHGRMEYLAGLMLSALIIVMGIELGRSSIEKIVSPSPVEAGVLPAAILFVSILMKIYMCTYNRAVGKKLGSPAMVAAAVDSLSDSVSTLVVLLSMAVSYVFGVNIDGWAGLVVAALICYTGWGAVKDTVSPLLGKAPERELVESIRNIVMAHPEIIGMHDLIVHDYGPGRLVVSLHAEVDGHGDIFRLHDAIDSAERELKAALGCLATIHMDPIDAQNTEMESWKHAVTELVATHLYGGISIHDFRVIPGETLTRFLFDVLLPVDFPMSDEAAAEKIRRLVRETWQGHDAIVTIDRNYV